MVEASGVNAVFQDFRPLGRLGDEEDGLLIRRLLRELVIG